MVFYIINMVGNEVAKVCTQYFERVIYLELPNLVNLGFYCKIRVDVGSG